MAMMAPAGRSRSVGQFVLSSLCTAYATGDDVIQEVNGGVRAWSLWG